jgi:hypothetical protein
MPEVATPNQAEREFETGADEFFKAHSELNALNGKRTYDEFQDISLTSARRSQAHFDDINARTLNSFEQLQTLQAKINEEHFASIHELRKHLANIQTDRQRHADIWAYEAAYDLGNPVTTAAGDNLRSGAATANRIVDTTGAVAGAGTAVAAEAVAAAVAKQVDATITPVLATLQQVVQALTTATTAIANVVNQAQPKTAA